MPLDSAARFGRLCHGAALVAAMGVIGLTGSVCLAPLQNGAGAGAPVGMLLPDCVTAGGARVYLRGWIWSPNASQEGRGVLAWYGHQRAHNASVFGTTMQLHLLPPPGGRHDVTAVGMAYDHYAMTRVHSRLWAIEKDTPLLILDPQLVAARGSATPEEAEACAEAMARRRTPVFVVSGDHDTLPEVIWKLRAVCPDALVAYVAMGPPYDQSRVLGRLFSQLGRSRPRDRRARYVTSDGPTAVWAANAGFDVWFIGEADLDGLKKGAGARLRRFASLESLKDFVLSEPI